MKVDVSDLKNIKCLCGSLLFEQAIMLKYVSMLQSETGRADYVSNIVLVCRECGAIVPPPDKVQLGEPQGEEDMQKKEDREG